jgi:integrase
MAPAVLAIIATVPHQGTGLLFITTGKTVVSGWSRAKDRLDMLLMAPGAEIGPPAPIPHWTLHDLHRSAATGMARLNVAPHVVEKILNHQSGTIRGVAAIYNRHAYLDERRAALALWAETVAGMVAV